MYNLEVKKFIGGYIFQKPGDDATEMYFLTDGVIEIYTENDEGHEIILEKLFRGSIINYRTFFLKYDGKVFYRFGRDSICSLLSYDKLLQVMPRHKDLLKVFTKFKK